MEEIKNCASIFDRLENQPHLQDLIKNQYMTGLMKDHEKHDTEKLVSFNETDAEGDYAYGPYSVTCMPNIHQVCLDELENDIENLKLWVRKNFRLSRDYVNSTFYGNYYRYAVDAEFTSEVHTWANKYRKKAKKARKSKKKIKNKLAILIQSVVRGWLVRRETK